MEEHNIYIAQIEVLKRGEWAVMLKFTTKHAALDVSRSLMEDRASFRLTFIPSGIDYVAAAIQTAEE